MSKLFLRNHKLYLTFVFIVLFNMVNAQKAELYGVVKDVSTNEVLPGATVALVGGSIGTITNMDGEFRISNITPGTYTLAFSYIGYLTEKLEVELKAKESYEQNMKLAYDAVSIGEVQVTAQVLGQARAINQQLNEDAIVNVVSSDKMKELPDVNAAEAIGRLPGISVQRNGGEASKVIIRGLSPKLTSVTINGVKMPATSSTDRSADLSNISPELLSSIEVFKSPTADMDGDAIGGTITLGIMKAPDKTIADVTVFGGYSGLDNSLGNYRGSLNLSKRFFNKKIGISVKGNYENTNRSSESVSSTYNTDNPEKFKVTRVILQDNNRIIQRMGGNIGLDYDYKTGSIIGQGFYSQRNSDLKVNENDLEDGTMVNHNPRHSKAKTSTYQAMLSGKQRVSVFELSYTLANSKVISDNYYDVQLFFEETAGQATDFENITIEDKISQLNYNYSNAKLTQYDWEPDYMEHRNNTVALDVKADYSLGDRISGFLKFGGKYRGDERHKEVEYKYIWDYYFNDETNAIAVQNMLPDVVETDPSDGRIYYNNFLTSNERLGIWNDQYDIVPEADMDYVDLWHERNKNSAILNEEKPYLNYGVKENVYAMYLMTKIKFDHWFTLIPGLRYEYSENEYSGVISSMTKEGVGSARDSATTQKYGELLPSVHLKLAPKQWFDIRLSAVKTLARPDYNMITPRARIDASNGVIYTGNPDLKHTEAWSYDAMVSFFSNRLGLVTVGGFYKHFDNYFTKTDGFMTEEQADEAGIGGGPYDVQEDYMNFDNSEVYGFEMDVQTNFSFLPKPFNGIVISANVTKLWSKTYNPLFTKETSYDPISRTTVIDTTYRTLQETSLPDQTDWTANLALGYDYKGFSSRISMIYQSAYLKGLTSAGQGDGVQYSNTYNDSFLRFDLSLSQTIGKHVKVMFNWANLTGESERTYQYLSKYPKKENQYSMTLDLGFRYTF